MVPTGEQGTWIAPFNGDVWDVSEDDINWLKTEKQYEAGQSQTYDVYQTEENAPYYTKGVSYYDLYQQ